MARSEPLTVADYTVRLVRTCRAMASLSSDAVSWLTDAEGHSSEPLREWTHFAVHFSFT